MSAVGAALRQTLVALLWEQAPVGVQGPSMNCGLHDSP